MKKIALAFLCLWSGFVGATDTGQGYSEYLLELFKEVKQVVDQDVSPDLALKIGRCSLLAAHPDDPGKVGKGISFNKIDTSKAIEACQDAYHNSDRPYGLVLAALSRAYNKAEDYDRSFAFAKKSVEADYPFGNVMLALHYHYGEGVGKSQKQQFRWYKKAAAAGVMAGMRATSGNYRDGVGTPKNLDEAYFWALSAVQKRDGNAFYGMGRVLEEKAQTSAQKATLLRLAIQSYEVADANGVGVKKELRRVSQQLNPNHIADDEVLFAKTIKGNVVDGVFHRMESNSNWYLGETPLTRQGHTYYYARTSYNNTVFTLWYKQGSSAQTSGWFIDLLYAGSNTIKKFDGISVLADIDGQTDYINLDISDPRIQELSGIYRITTRIGMRDVLMLQHADQVRFYYTAKNNRTPNYTMNLNQSESLITGDETAQNVLGNLVELVSEKAPDCCDQPNIKPLSKDYQTYLKSCESRQLDQIIKKNRVEQNCHNILKVAKPTTDLYLQPLSTNLDRLIDEIEHTIGNEP